MQPPKRVLRTVFASIAWSIATTAMADPTTPPAEAPAASPALLFVALEVESLDRSLDFYTRIVGMKENERYGSDARDNTTPIEVVLRFGDSASGAFVLLTQRRSGDPLRSNPAQLVERLDRVAFAVPELSLLMERVRAAGVRLKVPPKPVPEAGVIVAMIEDPDGHTLEFIEFVER